MKIALLSIGNELLSGDTINTNAAWIGKKLTEIGCNVFHQATVPDEKEPIINALNHSLKLNPDFILCTGGLGPTEDDITRQTLFDFVGTESRFDEEYWEYLSERFKQFGMDIPETNRNQALVPLNGDVIENPVGSARGSIFNVNGTTLISLPGVPAEMKAMMEGTVVPLIQSKGLKPKQFHTFRTTGIPESSLIEQIAPVMKKDHGCSIGYYPSLYGVDIRISQKEKEPVEYLANEIRKVLGVSIYSENGDSIEEVNVTLAIEKHKTIATAESCTGGLVGHRITEVSGSSDVYKGGLVVYSNEAKMDMLDVEKTTLEKFGAVSAETAESMAKNVMKKFDADFGISVTGIAGPTGGTEEKPIGLVYIGLADKNNTKVKKYNFGDTRKRNKLRTSQAALNWLRLTLLSL